MSGWVVRGSSSEFGAKYSFARIMYAAAFRDKSLGIRLVRCTSPLQLIAEVTFTTLEIKNANT